MPLVTIIMPAYQAARTIARAIASVRAQPFQDWQLVVVNDASTDETGRLADEIASRDPRVRVIHNGENLGAATSMNLAWKTTDSRYFAILDSDDAALAPRFSAPLAFLEGRSEISVVGGAAHFVDATGRFMRTVRMPRDHADLLRRRWYACPFVHSTVTMRRSFLEQTGGYPDGLRLGEDYDLWMRGFSTGQHSYSNLEEPLVVYTARPVQRWAMIRASARVRWRAGKRERRTVRGAAAAVRILAEGLVEQTGVFAWRDRVLRRGAAAAPVASTEERVV